MDSKVFTESDTADYYDSFGNVYELVWNEQIHTGYFDKEKSLEQAVIDMDVFLAEQAGLNKNSTIVVVGSGRGGADRFLAKEYRAKVIGIDLSEKQISEAREKSGNLDIQYIQASMTDIPLEKETADYIWIQESFFHCHDKPKAVSEFARILKKGGKVVMEDTLRLDESDSEEISSFCGRVKINELLTEKEHIDLFNKAGFELKKKVDVSDHLAMTYHKIVEFIENNRENVEEKVPEIYKDRIKTKFGFDVSERLVLEKKLGCMIFVFGKNLP